MTVLLGATLSASPPRREAALKACGAATLRKAEPLAPTPTRKGCRGVPLLLSPYTFYLKLTRSNPASQLPPHQRLQHIHPRRPIVQAIEHGELLAPGADKLLGPTNGQLLHRFEAIRRKARRGDHQPLRAPRGLGSQEERKMLTKLSIPVLAGAAASFTLLWRRRSTSCGSFGACSENISLLLKWP